MKSILRATLLFVLCVAALGQKGFPLKKFSSEAYRGILIDGSCRDRSTMNLKAPPAASPAVAPGSNTGAVSASGITVDAQTIQSERADILPHLVPDIRARQTDPACAVTGTTRAFAVWLDNGKLVDFGEGGNTIMLEAVQSTPAGREMLNGARPGLKLRVELEGKILNGQMRVDSVKSLTP